MSITNTYLYIYVSFCHFRQSTKDKVMKIMQLEDTALSLRSRSHIGKGEGSMLFYLVNDLNIPGFLSLLWRHNMSC